MYSMKIFVLLVALSNQVFSQVPPSKEVKCAVCRGMVAEFHHEINKVHPRKKIDVGSYRLQSDGGQKTTSRTYAGSETHLTDLMESLCGSFGDYAQARLKTTGELEAIRIVGRDGAMNPRFSEYDIVQDPDLNKGLEFHCNSIIEDFEDDILEYFSKVIPNPDQEDSDTRKSHIRFCNAITKVCPIKGKAEL